MKNSPLTKIISIAGLLIVTTGLLITLFSHFQKEHILTVGVAQWGSNPEFARSVDGFKEGLEEHGYIEGNNVRFIVKNSEADLEKQRAIIDSFIQAKVDLIYSLTTPGTMIAKELTSKMENPIPVVFSICTYPVESGLIDSLKSSGNNLVGTRNYVPPSKQYYVFEEIYSETKSLAVVRRKDEPNSTNQFNEIKNLLENRGIKIIDIAAVDLEDIRQQLQEHVDEIDSIFSTCDTLTHAGGEEIINDFSKQYKKPNFACNKEGVLKGALVGNVGDFMALGKIAGEKASLILQGSEPSWLQTESPREDYIVINLNTAETLGITVPQEVLAKARELIRD
ncbi:MAG: ABC transporter substrate-binding protein [SAR324 cluster bacterium]|nr:ABC transporter substrate-binding protein [SAR324 cluster bacterium]